MLVHQLQPSLQMDMPTSQGTPVIQHGSPPLVAHGEFEHLFFGVSPVPTSGLHGTRRVQDSSLGTTLNSYAKEQQKAAVCMEFSIPCPSNAPGQIFFSGLPQPVELPYIPDPPYLRQQQQAATGNHEGFGQWWQPAASWGIHSPAQPLLGHMSMAGSRELRHVSPANELQHTFSASLELPAGGVVFGGQRAQVRPSVDLSHMHNQDSDIWIEQAEYLQQSRQVFVPQGQMPVGDANGPGLAPPQMKALIGLPLSADANQCHGPYLDLLCPREFPTSSGPRRLEGVSYSQGLLSLAGSTAPALVRPLDTTHGHLDAFGPYRQRLQKVRISGNVLSDISYSTLQASNRQLEVRQFEATRLHSAGCEFPAGSRGVAQQDRADELENNKEASVSRTQWANHVSHVPWAALQTASSQDLLDGDAASLLPSDLLMDPLDDGPSRHGGQPCPSSVFGSPCGQQMSYNISPKSVCLPQTEYVADPFGKRAASHLQQASCSEQSTIQSLDYNCTGSGCMKAASSGSFTQVSQHAGSSEGLVLPINSSHICSIESSCWDPADLRLRGLIVTDDHSFRTDSDLSQYLNTFGQQISLGMTVELS